MDGRTESRIKEVSRMEKILEHEESIVKDYYISLLANGTNENDSYKTATTYTKVVIRFINSVKERQNKEGNTTFDPSQIKRIDVDRFLLNCKYVEENGEKREAKSSSVALYYSAMKNFCRWLYASEIKDRNLMDGIKTPSVRTNEIKRIHVSTDDLHQMMDNADTGVGTNRQKAYMENTKARDQLIMYMLMTTGIRRQALSEINVSDIDFKNRELHVTDKRRKVMTFPLGDDIMGMVKDYLIERETLLGGVQCDALFVSMKRCRLTGKAIGDLVRKLSEGTGKAISPHKIRAAFATNIYEQTHDIMFTMTAMHHSSPTITQRYVVQRSDTVERAEKIMEDLLRR